MYRTKLLKKNFLMVKTYLIKIDRYKKIENVYNIICDSLQPITWNYSMMNSKLYLCIAIILLFSCSKTVTKDELLLTWENIDEDVIRFVDQKYNGWPLYNLCSPAEVVDKRWKVENQILKITIMFKGGCHTNPIYIEVSIPDKKVLRYY